MEYGDLSAVWGYEGSRGKPNLGNLWGNGMRTAKLRNYATEARFKLATSSSNDRKRLIMSHALIMQSESRLSVVT
jgi:hypothetical protein